MTFSGDRLHFVYFYGQNIIARPRTRTRANEGGGGEGDKAVETGRATLNLTIKNWKCSLLRAKNLACT